MYSFKTYAPFQQRGLDFPNSIIRVRHVSLTISSNILENFQIGRTTASDGSERIRLLFMVDDKRKAIKIESSNQGYKIRIRANGNGFLNTVRFKSFGLPIGDYRLIEREKELIFELAS